MTNAAVTTSPLETVVAVVLGGALLVFLGGAIVVAYVYGFIGYNIIDPILGLSGAPTALAGTRLRQRRSSKPPQP